MNWQYSQKATLNEQLQGQVFWDNNNRISDDLYDLHFNMSISLAKEVSFFDQLDTHIQEMKEKKDIGGDRGRKIEKL